jgi:hypothetical protein
MASQAISDQDLDLAEPPFEPSLVAELLRAFAKAARASAVPAQ